MDDRVDRDDIDSFPLARYAAEYWPAHARVEIVSSHIMDGMERLFDADKPHFATWLWIYNRDRDNISMSTKRPEEPETVPLYYAARLGLPDLAERLIVEHPEHVNARGGMYSTPIHAAVNFGHAKILSLLIERGADIEGRSRSIYSGTLLNRAAWNRRLDVGQFLLDHGANIDCRDNSCCTPLIYTVLRDDVEFSRMLLERGAAVDASGGSQDRTSLHRAIAWKMPQLVQLLLEHGADVNVRDENGITPCELASSCGSQEIVELMSAYGAESLKR